MPASMTVPTFTCPVGSTDSASFLIDDADTMLHFSLSRLVAGGLESLTTATWITVIISQSDDDGASWDPRGGGTWPGGHQVDRNGVTLSTFGSNTYLVPGATGRRLKATATVTGPDPVVISGNVTTD
jgi:hypothetical protein